MSKMVKITISEIKHDFIQSIRSIDITVDGLTRRFERKLPYFKSVEELQEEIMDYVYEHNDRLSGILNKYDKLKDIKVEDIRPECWYQTKDTDYSCTVNLDDYYGIELYRYNLIIGGEDHGNFIINDHPDNSNKGSGKIIYKLKNWDNVEYHSYIDDMRDMIQDHFHCWENVEAEIKSKRQHFKCFIDRFRANAIYDVYSQFDKYYSSLIGYNDESRKIYYMMYNNSSRTLSDIEYKLQKSSLDIEYHAKLIELRKKIVSTQHKIKNWFENGQKCIYRICKQHSIPNEISKQIMCFV